MDTVAVALARVRIPTLICAVALLVVGTWLHWVWLVVVAAVGFVGALVAYFRLGTVQAPPVRVGTPVRGRWMAMNSPATRVPSHGLHAYGQTYAIDLAFEPEDRSRPAMGWSPVMRQASDFPGFGQPVVAPADGTVVRVRQRSRDHLSRNSWPALIYLLVEGSLRELTGPGRIVGNHVVIRLDSGEYAVLAHLRHRSIRPHQGDRVRAGEHIAECGNSGNTSEPHVHFQLMDTPYLMFAAGLPFTFSDSVIEGDDPGRLPANGQRMSVDGVRE